MNVAQCIMHYVQEIKDLKDVWSHKADIVGNWWTLANLRVLHRQRLTNFIVCPWVTLLGE